jgi:hypothetical protein
MKIFSKTFYFLVILLATFLLIFFVVPNLKFKKNSNVENPTAEVIAKNVITKNENVK